MPARRTTLVVDAGFEDPMTHPKAIAEFAFVTNKSFLGSGNPITIPSRFYEALKENGLVESTPVVISFANGISITGSIYINWRAGGKYYQLRMSVPENHEIARLKLGVTLHVRLLKPKEGWRIELQ